MLVPMGPQHPDWQLHVDALQADVALASGADGISLDRATFTRLYGRGRDFVERDRQRRQRDGLQSSTRPGRPPVIAAELRSPA